MKTCRFFWSYFQTLFMLLTKHITFSPQFVFSVDSAQPQLIMSLLWFLLRFDIVLMKEGRMKGQAFVGLPSEQSAEKALRETNGYVLFDKPLVVVSF